MGLSYPTSLRIRGCYPPVFAPAGLCPQDASSLGPTPALVSHGAASKTIDYMPLAQPRLAPEIKSVRHLYYSYVQPVQILYPRDKISVYISLDGCYTRS